MPGFGMGFLLDRDHHPSTDRLRLPLRSRSALPSLVPRVGLKFAGVNVWRVRASALFSSGAQPGV